MGVLREMAWPLAQKRHVFNLYSHTYKKYINCISLMVSTYNSMQYAEVHKITTSTSIKSAIYTVYRKISSLSTRCSLQSSRTSCCINASWLQDGHMSVYTYIPVYTYTTIYVHNRIYSYIFLSAYNIYIYILYIIYIPTV